MVIPTKLNYSNFNYFETFNLPKKTSKLFIHNNLERRLDAIKVKVSENPAYKLNSEEVGDIKKAVLDANKLFNSNVKKKLQQIPAETLKNLLHNQLIESSDAEQWMTVLIKLLPEEELMELSNSNSKESLRQKATTQSLLKDEALKSVLEVKGKALFSEFSTEAFYFIDHVLNLFIESLGLRDIGEPEHRQWGVGGGSSSFEAKYRLEMYLTILLYPSTIFGTVFSVTGNIPLALLAAVLITAATLAFLICYDRYLQPCPKECYGLDNLNMSIKKGGKPPIFSRRDVHSQMEEAFRSNKGVLLVGKAGTGKTKLVTSYAERVEQNTCCDLMRNKHLFSCNASSFGQMHGISFDGIKKRFKHHEGEAIFFFDEIHAAFVARGINGDSHDEFKTFCDKFPYVIAATTPEDFERHIKTHEAFLRRFKIIDISPLSEEEIETSLYENLHFAQPQLQLEEGVISLIHQKAKEYFPQTSPIDAAHALLANAIDRATQLTFEQLEKEMQALKTEKDKLKNQIFHEAEQFDTMETYKEVLSQLNDKEAQLDEKKKQLETLRKLEKTYLLTWQKGFRLAQNADKSPKNYRQWLENETLSSVLQETIQNYKNQLGLPPKLTKELVEQICREAAKTS